MYVARGEVPIAGLPFSSSAFLPSSLHRYIHTIHTSACPWHKTMPAALLNPTKPQGAPSTSTSEDHG